MSEWLDSTNPDLSRFAARGGKLIVAIGTDDTLASPGAQLDYYQSVIDKMGRTKVDSFARFFVINRGKTRHGFAFLGKKFAPLRPGHRARFSRALLVRGAFPYRSTTDRGKAFKGVFRVY